jgi:hypothetical protein
MRLEVNWKLNLLDKSAAPFDQGNTLGDTAGADVCLNVKMMDPHLGTELQPGLEFLYGPRKP